MASNEQGCALNGSSATTGVRINDNSKGSGSQFEEAIYEEPPKLDCKVPSRNSFLNIEFEPPFLNLLLRCT